MNEKPLKTTNSALELESARKAKFIARIERPAQIACGVESQELGLRLIEQVMSMQLWSDKKGTVERFAQAIAMLGEMHPKNAQEAMLAVQMTAVHETALVLLKRATLPGQTFEATDANVVRATRLMRVFNEQLGLLAKLQGRTGQQKVVVEHVNVEPGGNAIVGPVTHTEGNKSCRMKEN
jgi:hypothetical protein